MSDLAATASAVLRVTTPTASAVRRVTTPTASAALRVATTPAASAVLRVATTPAASAVLQVATLPAASAVLRVATLASAGVARRAREICRWASAVRGRGSGRVVRPFRVRGSGRVARAATRASRCVARVGTSRRAADPRSSACSRAGSRAIDPRGRGPSATSSPTPRRPSAAATQRPRSAARRSGDEAQRRSAREAQRDAAAAKRSDAAATKRSGDAAPAKRSAPAEKSVAGDAPAAKSAVAGEAPAAKRDVSKPDVAAPGVARSVRGWSETPTGKPRRTPAPSTRNPIKGPERLAPAKIRLQKVLASAGVAARRKAEDLIARGRVTVNGRVANELGVKVDPDRDQIRVDGKVVQVETRVHFVLNKPDGVVCSAEGEKDAEGRPTVLSLLPTVSQRIYPVGRLDYHTRGVLILTNDGDLAAALTHPRHKVPKTYHVKFQGRLGDEALAALGQGITLDDGVVTRPAEEVSVIKETETNTWVQITLRQGLNRQVRRMGDAIGHPVLKLIRVAVGPVTADGLADGEFRPLTPTEVYDLMAAASR
jgi:23S rRNA pseudouridine2605 synthase